MTIGQRITQLRRRAGLSQEQLAQRLAVSRQSVSKWEVDAAVPQLDKILQLTALFGITADALLCPQEATPAPQRADGALHYFGTDGFRAEAGVGLTSMHAYRVGRFLGWYFGRGRAGGRARIVVGKDTRRSSYMLEYSLVAGITASGADAYMLHVITTPGVSYVTRQDDFDCGIMITASHNPFYDNGIKLINRHGEKMDDRTVALVEAYIDGDMAALGLSADELPEARREGLGCIHDYVSGRNRYIGYLISVASHSYKHLRIGLDCANGASFTVARAVFGALGAKVQLLGDAPDGLNINRDCGSTHIEALARTVKEGHLDVGFAFDGDADRCLAVDGDGRVVDGDAILYILAARLKRHGMLSEDTVVATVMSNSGFVQSLARRGIRCETTAVGDRFVYERMQEGGFHLGGESSGHIILKKYATTGDGLLTAIMLTEELCDTKKTLAELTEGLTVYPQLTLSVRVKDKDAVLRDGRVTRTLAEIQEAIGARGRALLRRSGTEAVVRVMVECETPALCRRYADRLVEVIREGGYACD